MRRPADRPGRAAARALLAALLAAALAAPLAGCGGSGGETVRWFIGQEDSGAYRQAAAACTAASGGRYTIALEELPRSSDRQREQLVRRLAARDRTVDLVGMDVIWTAEFAEAGWLRPWEGERATAVSRGVLVGPLATATYRGRLWAAPLTGNTQLLWYRKSRVPKPAASWDGLISQAEALPDGQDVVAVQGARYEGYTAWVASLLASAGTGLVADADDPARARADLAAGPARRALAVVRRLAHSRVADPGLAAATELSTRQLVLSGTAALTVAYPTLWASARAEAPEILADLGWARYPGVVAGRPGRPPLGGVNLGVSAYSPHPDDAFAAAACLRGPANQKLAALQGGLPPALGAVYDDPDVARRYPFRDLLRTSIAAAVPRPETPAYNDVSLAVQQVLHPPSGVDPAAAVPALRKLVDAALDSQALLS
ncbi:MAG: extracellular solute-binding protein [Mycobacteriales bacterium]